MGPVPIYRWARTQRLISSTKTLVSNKQKLDPGDAYEMGHIEYYLKHNIFL